MNVDITVGGIDHDIKWNAFVTNTRRLKTDDKFKLIEMLM